MYLNGKKRPFTPHLWPPPELVFLPPSCPQTSALEAPLLKLRTLQAPWEKIFCCQRHFHAITWNMCGEQLWSQRACQGFCSPRPMWGWAQTQIGGLQLRQNYEKHNILISKTGRPNSHVLKTFEWETEWVGPGSRVGARLEKEDTRDVSGLLKSEIVTISATLSTFTQQTTSSVEISPSCFQVEVLAKPCWGPRGQGPKAGKHTGTPPLVKVTCLWMPWWSK